MKNQICLVPKLTGLGGMVSFQARMIAGLKAHGIPYNFEISYPQNAAILVIGGTRQIWKLKQAKRHGTRIIQRLNGMNWIHRLEKTDPRSFLRSEINNYILAYIRRHLADQIVYQSNFCHDWWKRIYGAHSIPYQITYNGVDLDQFSPNGPETPPKDHFRLLLVEGHLVGAYARGLETAIKLAEQVRKKHRLPIELMIAGNVSEQLKIRAHNLAPDLWITWLGVLPREYIAAIDRSAHVLFSADLNAACPNSVIEALACGTPVLAYDTGALKELISDGAGVVVPYGSDHWKLEEPQIPPLAEACVEIFEDNVAYRTRARARAEAIFDLDTMVSGYLTALGVL
jgi:glycosyltransferase involved in cell wall biosynthesis